MSTMKAALIIIRLFLRYGRRRRAGRRRYAVPLIPPTSEQALAARFTIVFQHYMSCSAGTCEIPQQRRNEFIEALAREAAKPARYY